MTYAYYAGSGGGISLLEAQPAYQAKDVPSYLATTLNLASGSTTPLPNPQRVSPDVAMDADPYTGYLVGETFTISGTIADKGCTAMSKTEEYCEVAFGGTSLSSPLMAGVFAVMNQRRAAHGEPLVGFANPLLYSIGSRGNGTSFNTAAINQIIAPKEAVSVLRGYATDLNLVRVVTINSVGTLHHHSAVRSVGLRLTGVSGDQRDVQLHLRVAGDLAADACRLQRCHRAGCALGAEADPGGITG